MNSFFVSIIYQDEQNVPEPFYREDFEDLAEVELHNGASQSMGKVRLLSDKK